MIGAVEVKMFKYFLIPVFVVIAMFVLPRTLAELFNSHSDIGLLGAITLVSLIFGYTANYIINLLKKD